MANFLVVIWILSLLAMVSPLGSGKDSESCFLSAECAGEAVLLNNSTCGSDCDNLQILKLVRTSDQTYFVTDDRHAKYGTPPVVAFEMTAYRVREGESTTVCVNIYAPSMVRLVAHSNAMIRNYSITISINDTEKTDISEAVNRTINFNATGESQCINITIPNDEKVEEDAIFEYIVTEEEERVTVNQTLSHGKLEILDNDFAVVGLESTFYTVSEDQVAVNVCAIVYSPDIECPVKFAFEVLLSTSAESTTDNFAFDICEKEKCVNISIVNDSELEMTETFNITLERTDDLNERIILCPVNGVIAISDNGYTVKVDLEMLYNNVTEDMGVVEVCAVLESPNNSCVMPFNVSISTNDITASSDEDYSAVPLILSFDDCKNKSCVNVSVVDDDVVEMAEFFTITLERTSDLDSRIMLNQRYGVIEIIDNDAIEVHLEHSCYQVFENDDNVKVCAIINSSLECPVSFPFEVILTSSDGTADANSDYNMSINSAPFKECQKKSCVNVSIMDDNTVEMRMESFNISLEMPSDERIKLNTQGTTIIIYDDDMAQVRLDDPEPVNEADGVVEVCALLNNEEEQDGFKCPAKFPIIISLSITAVTTLDNFTTLDNYYSTLLIFDECNTSSCVNVSIEDDLVVEMPESFTVTLGIIDIPGQGNIVLDTNNVERVINITDNDVAQVGLEKTVYHVSESQNTVEVCAIVYSPDIDRPVAFPFDVILIGHGESTANFNVTLNFSDCERTCAILPNTKEEFYITLQRNGDLDDSIILSPVNGVIVISDLCPRLTDPDNGNLVLLTGVSEGHVAAFTCNFGYKLVGATNLTCQNGEWSDPPPECKSFAFVLHKEKNRADGSEYAELVATGGYLNQDILFIYIIQTNSTLTSKELKFSESCLQASHEGRRTYCTRAGFYTCCSGKGEDCKVAGEDCYCDAVCHFHNDCCDDIQRICPAYWEKIYREGEIVSISTESTLVFIKEESFTIP